MYENGHFFEKNNSDSFASEKDEINKRKLKKDNVLGAIYIFFKYNLIKEVKYIINFKILKIVLLKIILKNLSKIILINLHLMI